MKLTKRQREALEILKANPKIGAPEFSVLFWPDSNMHRRVSNQGHGACRGKAAWLCAGSYIATLAKRGLASADFSKRSYARCYSITQAGLDALKQK